MARSFFERPVLGLARDLVGAVLVHRSAEGLTAGRIVETEAYRGPEDRAAHSAGGRRTARTEAMFGEPATVYVFLLYGTSWAFNIVAGSRDEPHAVLVRALEPVAGIELMTVRRKGRPLTNGPGKLCQAMGIDRRHYGTSLFGGNLVVLPGPRGPVGTSARINVDYAGEWAARPWRFYERGNRWVSVPPRG